MKCGFVVLYFGGNITQRRVSPPWNVVDRERFVTFLVCVSKVFLDNGSYFFTNVKLLAEGEPRSMLGLITCVGSPRREGRMDWCSPSHSHITIVNIITNRSRWQLNWCETSGCLKSSSSFRPCSKITHAPTIIHLPNTPCHLSPTSPSCTPTVFVTIFVNYETPFLYNETPQGCYQYVRWNVSLCRTVSVGWILHFPCRRRTRGFSVENRCGFIIVIVVINIIIFFFPESVRSWSKSYLSPSALQWVAVSSVRPLGSSRGCSRYHCLLVHTRRDQNVQDRDRMHRQSHHQRHGTTRCLMDQGAAKYVWLILQSGQTRTVVAGESTMHQGHSRHSWTWQMGVTIHGDRQGQ